MTAQASKDPALSNMSSTLPSRPRHSSKPATVDEYISWLTELAEREGQFGMSTEMLSSSEFSALFSVGESDELPSDPYAKDLNNHLGDVIKDWSRDQYLVKVLNENAFLLPQVKREINARLIAADMSADFIQSPWETTNLMARIAHLENLKNPPPTPKPKYMLWLEIYHHDSLSSKDKLRLYINKDGDFSSFLAIMRDHSVPTARITLGLQEGLGWKEGFWVYQLLRKQMQSSQGTPLVKLDNGLAYSKMLREIAKPETPSAFLRHERIIEWEAKKQAELKAFEEEYHASDQCPLDEDGEPYFDPNPDWNKVWKKYIEERARAAGEHHDE